MALVCVCVWGGGGGNVSQEYGPAQPASLSGFYLEGPPVSPLLSSGLIRPAPQVVVTVVVRPMVVGGVGVAVHATAATAATTAAIAAG